MGRTPEATLCAPQRHLASARRVTGTCLTPPEVLAVANSLSSGSGSMAGPSPAKPPSPAQWGPAEVRLARQLVARLRDALGTRPGQEHEWLGPVRRRDPALGAHLERQAFRPKRPASWRARPRMWLTELDIAAVMRQYEGLHGFHFVGVFPRDFAKRLPGGACVSRSMCALNVPALLAKGTRRLGFVVNMDDHTQRGSHWAACYVGLQPRAPARFGVWYYDSVAQPPPAEVTAFMQRMRAEVLQAFGPRVGARFVCEHNTVQRQFQDTECGIYACLFLVACITTRRSFSDICQTVMQRDERVASLRHVFFRGG